MFFLLALAGAHAAAKGQFPEWRFQGRDVVVKIPRDSFHEPQSAACEAAAAAAAAKNSSPAPVLIIDAPSWFCTSDSVGNHLPLYFTLRALALLHGIGFQMQPTCGPIIRDTPKYITGWLPQSASPNWPPEVPRDPGTIMREIEGTCKCRTIITHVCTYGWPLFAAVWGREIRAAAERYSVARKGVLASNGSKTQKYTYDLDDAVIHFRCGDIMEMDASRGPLNSGFVPLSVLLRYLRPLAPRSVGIVTTPLVEKCSSKLETRAMDCKHGKQCHDILEVLLPALQSGLTGPRKMHGPRVRIHDKDTTVGAMSRIALAQLSICPPSTFCVWPALGAVEGVLTGVGGGHSIALEPGKRAAAALGEGHLHVHALHGSNASILSIKRIKEAQMSPQQIGQFLVEH